MAGFRLKFSSSALWLLATASLLALEVCATTHRVLPPAMANHHALVSQSIPDHSLVVGEVGTDSGSSAVLVIGNVGAVEDGEVEVTLKAVPVHGPGGSPSATTTEHRTNYVRSRDPGSSSRVRTSPKTETTLGPLARIYFLPTAIPEKHRDVTYAAVSCRIAAENHRARVYVDQRLPQDDRLSELVNSIDNASSSEMVDTIERLVGLPWDLDGDGHLTIVVTPELNRLGTTNAPVRGLTQPNDFVPEIDRPYGNQSDVIYLSSSLNPGEHLNAVLAHEWCHASVFSRRVRGTAGDLRADEDWLSEAIAHVVEVASSGSDSNIAHRVQSYLSHPAHSPLVVRDYCRPEYWRHHGCRGAGYLFLRWCLEESAGIDLEELTRDEPLNVQGLETATHRIFEELFANWTLSLAKQLAADLGSGCMPATGEQPLAYRTWKLAGTHEQTLVIRIGGTCADFLHVQCPGPSRWQVSVATSKTGRLRASLLPVIAVTH